MRTDTPQRFSLEKALAGGLEVKGFSPDNPLINEVVETTRLGRREKSSLASRIDTHAARFAGGRPLSEADKRELSEILTEIKDYLDGLRGPVSQEDEIVLKGTEDTIENWLLGSEKQIEKSEKSKNPERSDYRVFWLMVESLKKALISVDPSIESLGTITEAGVKREISFKNDPDEEIVKLL